MLDLFSRKQVENQNIFYNENWYWFLFLSKLITNKKNYMCIDNDHKTKSQCIGRMNEVSLMFYV
jgi:hypothetical protein